MPRLRAAGTTSWPSPLRWVTTFDPIRPVPPTTTIFIAQALPLLPRHSPDGDLAAALDAIGAVTRAVVKR